MDSSVYGWLVNAIEVGWFYNPDGSQADQGQKTKHNRIQPKSNG